MRLDYQVKEIIQGAMLLLLQYSRHTTLIQLKQANSHLMLSQLESILIARWEGPWLSSTLSLVSYRTLQVSMPRSNVIILTDPNSKFSITHGSAVILPIEGNYSRENLMLQRIRSYIAFLEQRLEELGTVEDINHLIFTDSDIAVVTDLGHIFEMYPHCHLALTFRNNKGQPLNSGFVAVRGTRDGIFKAIEFFKEVLEAYHLKYMKASRMLGDQLALAWVVKSHLPSAFSKFSKHEAFTGEVNGASILFLPCAVYNWTPPEGAGQFHGMPLDVKVVHFKGSRKRLMLEAWNFYNSTSELSDMLCLILRSGRTKYDF